MVDSTNLPNVDINQIATDLNNKMDRDGVNATCPMVISRERDDRTHTIVEIWNDGYCVQQGYKEGVNGSNTVNLPQPYINEFYAIQLNRRANAGTTTNYTVFTRGVTTNSFGFYTSGVTSWTWRTEGYIR